MLVSSDGYGEVWTWTLPEGVENEDAVRDFSFAACDERDCPMNGGSCSVDVHIAWADFTLYVDPPEPSQSTIVANGNDVGHTFFKIDVDPYILELGLISGDTSTYVGIAWGFYPTNENISTEGTYLGGYTKYECDGELRNDSSHGWYVNKIYSIESLSNLNSSLNAIYAFANNATTPF
jgi:hypothetical protein